MSDDGMESCPACFGSGETTHGDEPCYRCGGTGKVPKQNS